MRRALVVTILLVVAALSLLIPNYVVMDTTNTGCNSGYYGGCQQSVTLTVYPYIGYGFVLLAIAVLIVIADSARSQNHVSLVNTLNYVELS